MSTSVQNFMHVAFSTILSTDL